MQNPLDAEPADTQPATATATATATQPRSSQARSSQTRSSRVWVPILAIALLAAAFLNAPYSYTVVSPISAGPPDAVVDFNVNLPSPPRMAGWPLRYWISYPATQNASVAYSRFAFTPLAINLSAIAIVGFALGVYVYRRPQPKNTTGKRGTKITIADVLLVTLLVAAGFGWWRRLDGYAARQQALVTELRHGGCDLSMNAWIPAIYSRWIPPSVSTRLRQFRSLRMEHPSETMVANIADFNGLQSLRLGGDTYDLRMIEPQINNPHLVDLRIAGRELDVRAFQAIAAMPRLQSLNLDRTNVTADVLRRFDSQGNLKQLSVLHSDVDWNDLASLSDGDAANPAWAAVKSIGALRLGHPMPGDEAELKIVGWPMLETLIINELESQLNSTPMKVELADLPVLSKLELDAFQKFDLTIRNVPKLIEISEVAYEWRDRLPRGASLPGMLWFNRVTIENADSLATLSFDGRSVEQIHYSGTPNLAMLGIAAYDRKLQDSSSLKELNPKAANAIIAGIGASDGPPLVDLEAVPLSGIDLTPLAANRGITNLKLGNSGVTPKQWKTLGAMKQLTDLQIDIAGIDGQSIKWILDQFPELANLELSPPNYESNFSSFDYQDFDRLQSLKIVDRPKLKSLKFDASNLMGLDTVQIARVPQFTTELRFGYVSQLELVDVPSVRGLSVAGPMPMDAKLEGLRDLRFFAAGGPTVTDATVTAITKCKAIETLTLAYPSVTPGGLKSLPIHDRMTSITLPGSALDDEVALSWPPLTSLMNLNVSDTKITSKGIAHLCGGSLIKRLVIDRVSANRADLDFLANFVDLEHLSLVGVGIDPKPLERLLTESRVSALDLSDSSVTAAHIDAIMTSGGKLRWVGLRNTEIDQAKFRELIVQQPELTFDVDPSSFSTEMATWLISSRRMLDQEQWAMRLAQQQYSQQARQGVNLYAAMLADQPAQKYELIDVSMFSQIAKGGTGSVGQGQIIFSGGQPQVFMSPAVPAPAVTTTPSAPAAVQVGQWLGGLFSGPAETGSDDVTDEAADSPPDPINESDILSGTKETEQ
ncbi:MAG: hypothetical protein WBD31_20620 [Rubripirellula sp.]